MLRWAVEEYNGPVAIRYPRGTEGAEQGSAWTGLEKTCVCHRTGKDVTFVTYGTLLGNTLAAADILAEEIRKLFAGEV